MFFIRLTPSSSDSSLIFFIATISPVFLFCPWCSASKCLKTKRQTQCLETLKTTPYVPSPSLFSLTKSSSLWPERWEVILPRYSERAFLYHPSTLPLKIICWTIQDGGSGHGLVSFPINYFLTKRSKHIYCTSGHYDFSSYLQNLRRWVWVRLWPLAWCPSRECSMAPTSPFQHWWHHFRQGYSIAKLPGIFGSSKFQWTACGQHMAILDTIRLIYRLERLKFDLYPFSTSQGWFLLSRWPTNGILIRTRWPFPSLPGPSPLSLHFTCIIRTSTIRLPKVFTNFSISFQVIKKELWVRSIKKFCIAGGLGKPYIYSLTDVFV